MFWKRLLLAFLVAPLPPSVVQATVGDSDYHPLAVLVIALTVIYVLQLIADRDICFSIAPVDVAWQLMRCSAFASVASSYWLLGCMHVWMTALFRDF
jgi:hypothetical protein